MQLELKSLKDRKMDYARRFSTSLETTLKKFESGP